MTKHKPKYKPGDRVLFQESSECFPYSGEVILREIQQGGGRLALWEVEVVWIRNPEGSKVLSVNSYLVFEHEITEVLHG